MALFGDIRNIMIGKSVNWSLRTEATAGMVVQNAKDFRILRI